MCIDVDGVLKSDPTFLLCSQDTQKHLKDIDTAAVSSRMLENIGFSSVVNECTHTRALCTVSFVNKGLITAPFTSAAQKVTPGVSPDVIILMRAQPLGDPLRFWGWLGLVEAMTERVLAGGSELLIMIFDNDYNGPIQI